MLFKYSLSTPSEGLCNITALVRDAATKSNTQNGICVVYCPHTTAGVTVNEGYDDDVARDLICGLKKSFPDRAEFRHSEGNSAAHLRASAVGASQTLVIENGELLLGIWQAVFFCEFDGPRKRKFYVNILG